MIFKPELARRILRGLNEGLTGNAIPHEGYSDEEFSECAKLLHKGHFIVALYLKGLQTAGAWSPYRLTNEGKRLLERSESYAVAQPARPSGAHSSHIRVEGGGKKPAALRVCVAPWMLETVLDADAPDKSRPRSLIG